MNKKYLLFGSAFLMAAIIMNTTTVNSNPQYPPAGSAGDPLTSKTCAQSGCHPQPDHTPTANDLTINIGTGTPSTPLNSSFKYTGGTTYNIAFLPNAFTGMYGFQIIALTSSNTMAGTFTVTNAATTKIVTAGNYQYMGHLNASATKNWVFKWNAPAASTGNVTFYYSYNTADGDGNPTGDVIYKGSVTIQPNTTGIYDLSETVADLNVFPNPVSNEFGMSFNLKENAQLQAEVYNINGDLISSLMNENLSEGTVNRTFDISNLSSGIYMLKVSSGEKFVTKKFFKQ